jgi:hypothetical protein
MLHSRVSSWPYQQTFVYAGKACHGHTLQLLMFMVDDFSIKVTRLLGSPKAAVKYELSLINQSQTVFYNSFSLEICNNKENEFCHTQNRIVLFYIYFLILFLISLIILSLAR